MLTDNLPWLWESLGSLCIWISRTREGVGLTNSAKVDQGQLEARKSVTRLTSTGGSRQVRRGGVPGRRPQFQCSLNLIRKVTVHICYGTIIIAEAASPTALKLSGN